MGVREIFGALGRRWYVVVLGVLLTLGMGWQIYQTTPPEYTARSLVLLLPPKGDPTVKETAGGNPFLSLSGLDLTARVVIATYTSTAFTEELEKISPYAEVEVTIDSATRGGIIAVIVKDQGEAQTLRTLDYVTTDVSERLQSLQKEVNVTSQDAVRSMVLAMDTEAKRDFQTLIRVLVLVLVGGFGATFAITVILDVILARRNRRHSEFSPVSGSTRWKRGADPAKSKSGPSESQSVPVIGKTSLPDLDDDFIAAKSPRHAVEHAPSAPRPAHRQDSTP